MNETGATAECSREDCGHWEAKTRAFSGHCSHASCPNYMEACPVHGTPVPARECIMCADPVPTAGRNSRLPG